MGKRLSLLGLCLAIALTPGAVTAYADAPVRILENRHTVRFAEGLSFFLGAEAGQPIRSVTLYFREQKATVTSRVVPDFAPGERIEASYEKHLERGDIHPGAVIEYYWLLELADGTHYETEPLTFAYDDDRFRWQQVQADNLTILYYGESSQAALAQSLMGRAQETLTRLQTEIGVTLQDPVRIYVYGSAQDMAAALSPRSEGFDEMVLTLGVAVSDDTLLLLGDHHGVQQTIAHELSHIVVGLATKNPYAPLPRWLDEGLAMLAEDSLPADNAAALERAVKRDDLISVRSLSSYTGDAEKVDLYYGEVHSVTSYLLRTYGRDKMTELLQVFKAGSLQEDALRQVYGIGLDELDAQWRESLGLEPRPSPDPASTTAAATAQPARSRESRPLCPLAGIASAFALAMGLALRRAPA